MLHVNDLTFRIEGRTLFDQATFALPAKAKMGLVGRNGTGKTYDDPRTCIANREKGGLYFGIAHVDGAAVDIVADRTSDHYPILADVVTALKNCN